MTDESKFLTVKEVAGRLGLHYGTVYRLIKTKKLPAAHFGGSIRVLESSLEEFGKDKQEVSNG